MRPLCCELSKVDIPEISVRSRGNGKRPYYLPVPSHPTRPWPPAHGTCRWSGREFLEDPAFGLDREELVMRPPTTATAAKTANTYWMPKSPATIQPTKIGPIDDPALSQALPNRCRSRADGSDRARPSRDRARTRWSAVSRRRRWPGSAPGTAEVAPSHGEEQQRHHREQERDRVPALAADLVDQQGADDRGDAHRTPEVIQP